MKFRSRNPIILDAPAFGQDNFFLEDMDFEDEVLGELTATVKPDVKAYAKKYFSKKKGADLGKALAKFAVWLAKEEAGMWALASKENWNLLMKLGQGEFTRQFTNQMSAKAGAKLAKPAAKKKAKPKTTAKKPVPKAVKSSASKAKELNAVATAATASLNAIPKDVAKIVIPQLNQILKLLKLNRIQSEATNEHRNLLKVGNFRKKVLADLARINAMLPAGHPAQRRIGNAISRSLGY